MTSALEGCEGVSVTPRPHPTSGKDPVPIVQEAKWASGPVWTGAENLAPTGIRSPDRPAHRQPLYRLRYPAHCCIHLRSIFFFVVVPCIFILSKSFLFSPTDALYRVSQEECARLRESVPYVKLYRYNPKHLYPKLNGYGDNGHRKMWASRVSTYCTPSVTPYSSTARARQRNIVMQ